jgi:hypothetical protein
VPQQFNIKEVITMDFDWKDMALAGALAEEITEEERERMRQLKQDTETQDPLDENEDQSDDIDIEKFIP